MSLRFSYHPFHVHTPAYALHGATVRWRPMVRVTVVGPRGTALPYALVDSGADDTVFPTTVAAQIGLDLSNAPQGGASGVGRAAAALRFAEVELRLTDGREFRRWRARVGFTDVPLQYALLGYAGVLQFFTTTFHGDRCEVELTVNGTYPGT